MGREKQIKEKRIFSLSELASSLENQIKNTYRGTYWIKAEVLKLNHYPQSGHCYPQLVEKRSGSIVADFKGFINKTTFHRIKSEFEEITGKELGDGMQILFKCKIGFHAVYGLSINILDIEASYTLGEMARMRNEAIRKLRAEGIFNRNRELHLPLVLKRIAVISVETSKGLLDFRRALGASAYSNALSIKLFPALLQGDAAILSIIRALNKLRPIADHFDAVTIIRGGGGETGLDCYDSYDLAREVCLFPIPVITGIGHASNLTLTEQVAHNSLLTPTDLAGFVISRFRDFENRINEAANKINRLSVRLLNSQAKYLDGILNKLYFEASHTTSILKNGLNQKTEILARSAKQNLNKSENILIYRIGNRLSSAALSKLQNTLSNLNLLQSRLNKSALLKTQNSLQELTLISEKINILDPKHILKRGFSITELNGRKVKSSRELKEGDELRTFFFDGDVTSTIISE